MTYFLSAERYRGFVSSRRRVCGDATEDKEERTGDLGVVGIH